MPSKLLTSYLYLFTMFFAQLFMTRAITQNLGIELYGVWAILISIQTYLFAVDSGFSSSVTTYANIFIEKSDKKSVRNLLSTNFALVSIIFLSIFIVFLIISGPIQNLLAGESSLVFSDWSVSISIVILNVYTLSIIGIFSNYLIATYRIEISKLFQIAHILLYASLVYIAAINGYSIRQMLFLIAITSIFYFLTLILYIKLKDDHVLPKSFFYFDKSLYNKISKFIYNTFILAIASRIQFYTDVLVIGSIIGLGSAGLFDINNKIPFYSTYVFSAFVAIYYPLFTKRYHSNNQSSLSALFLSIQNYSIVLAIGVSVVLIFYGQKFIIFWVGDDMFIGINIFLLLIFSMLMHAIYGPSAVALQAIGKNSKLMKYEVITAIINIGLSLLLVIPFGIVGVIYGTIISQFLALIFVYVHLLKILHIAYKSFIIETLIPIFILIIFLFSLFYISRSFWTLQVKLLHIFISSGFIMLITLISFIILEAILVTYKIKSFSSISNVLIKQDLSLIGKNESSPSSSFQKTYSKFNDAKQYLYAKFIILLRLLLRKLNFLQPLVLSIKFDHSKFAWKYFPFLWPYEKTNNINELYLEELTEPNLVQIIQILNNIFGLKKNSTNKTICELGCNKGQKLYALSNSFPSLRYIGFDINKKFVIKGNNYLNTPYFNQNDILLSIRDIESSSFKYSANITFTSLTLMYVKPEKIEKLINNIANSSSDGFIFQELASDNETFEVLGHSHDYEKIFLNLDLYKSFDIEINKKQFKNANSGSSYLNCISAVRKHENI